MTMELDIRDYLRIVRRRLWILVASVAIACSATAAVSILLMDPVYESSTKLIVNKRSDLSEQLDLNSVNLNIRLIDTYKEIIKTNAIMDKVAAEYPEFGLTASELINKVRISSVNNTQVMTLSVRDSNYQRTADVANAVAAVFIREIPNIMTVDNVSILNKAEVLPNASPVQPNIPLNIAISFVVGLMAGIGIAFLLEYMDDTIKTEQDAAMLLDLPTLAAIPKMTKADYEQPMLFSALRETKRAGEVNRVTINS